MLAQPDVRHRALKRVSSGSFWANIGDARVLYATDCEKSALNEAPPARDPHDAGNKRPMASDRRSHTCSLLSRPPCRIGRKNRERKRSGACVGMYQCRGPEPTLIQAGLKVRIIHARMHATYQVTGGEKSALCGFPPAREHLAVKAGCKRLLSEAKHMCCYHAHNEQAAPGDWVQNAATNPSLVC